jgi:ABC-type sugar transport system ATPase subunit
VTCALGSFPAADFEDGTRVDVVLRPSAIDLHSAGIGVDATVRRARLLGEESLIEVEVGGHDALLQVRIRGTWLPAEGTHVKASADPERALLFEKAADA